MAIAGRQLKYCSEPLTPEHLVLLTAARTKLSDNELRDLQQLADEPVDWQEVLHLADQHGVAPLLHRNLKAACWPGVPDSVAQELYLTFMTNAVRAHQDIAHVQWCCDLLENNNIPVVPFKGLTVALQAYGDPALRPSSDIDLLVRPRDYEKANHLFSQQGFEERKRYEWEVTLVSDERNLTVDLHNAISGRHFPVQLDFDGLYSRRTIWPVAKGEIHALSTEDAILVASIQIAKVYPSRQIKLKSLCDVEAMIAATPDLDWAGLLRNARQSGCLRMLLVTLVLAKDLLDADLPDQVLAQAARVPQIDRMAADRFAHILEPDDPSVLSSPPSWFHSLVRERKRDRIHSFLYLNRWRFMPNERDHDFVALPEGLSWLYWLVRPIRLLVDRAKGASG